MSILFAVEKQLGLYRQRIEELFGRHPDHDLFGSLPGAGPKLAPRLLSEIGDDRTRFGGDPQGLQCLAGTAPVTRRTGKARSDPPRWPCHQRWACDKHLRYAIYLFTEHTLTQCAWAEIYYRRHRDKGRSHADALRRLGQRWRENHPPHVEGSKTVRRDVAQPKPTQTRFLGAATQRPLNPTNLQTPEKDSLENP